MSLPPVHDAAGPVPYAIGSDIWPGLSKLAEELGELQAVIGKLLAYPSGVHPDGGPPLEVRLVKEAADVSAAVDFLMEANPRLPRSMYSDQYMAKLQRFRDWHNGRAAS